MALSPSASDLWGSGSTNGATVGRRRGVGNFHGAIRPSVPAKHFKAVCLGVKVVPILILAADYDLESVAVELALLG